MLHRRHGAGTSFPSVDEDEVDAEDLMDGYEEWREEYRLEAGPSRIRQLELPEVPPALPMPTSTVFPDEMPEPQAGPSSHAARKASPIARITSRTSTPTPSSPRITRGGVTGAGAGTGTGSGSRPVSPSRPMDLASQSELFANTASLNEIQPMKRSYTPPNSYSVPDWIPIDNYRPATAPISPAAKIPPMPLTSGYTLTLPRLPPEPPHPAKRHRRSSKADERDRASLYRLQIQFGLNPLSDALARSTKVVLTQDWKIAQAELRHIRAMERIEAKKNDGRWSLRQPKKLRGPPIPKGHWDYLLEEMVRRSSKCPIRAHNYPYDKDICLDNCMLMRDLRNGCTSISPRKDGGSESRQGNSRTRSSNGIWPPRAIGHGGW